MDAPSYLFERNPVLVCQCVMPCHIPVRDAEGRWYGCELPSGHAADVPHSLEGPGLHYRDVPAMQGPRVVLKPDADDPAHVSGFCPRCHAAYEATAVSQGGVLHRHPPLDDVAREAAAAIMAEADRS